MNALLISPACPQSYWSLEHANAFMKVKANMPPLGLMTIAGMMPQEWNLRFLDLNITQLEDNDLRWADMVFITAMHIQLESADSVAGRARAAGATVVAGGPYYTIYGETAPDIDHYFIGESEVIFPEFIKDLEAGRTRKIYRSESFSPLDQAPLPRWDIVNLEDYLTMPVQSTRGCPHNCEFCHVAFLNGRVPRHKSISLIIEELEAIRRTGWHRQIMFVDDNFIGNRKHAKKLLRELVAWLDKHGHPFDFFVTQASIDLADDPELMELMASANFKLVFIGIESPSPEALRECGKKQNLTRNMQEAVKRIRGYGMDIMAGFIVGFDSDTPEIFEMQHRFIEEAPINTAMIGLLVASIDTPLWNRLEKEGRLVDGGFSSGNNTMDENVLNFVPAMDRDILIQGYRDLIAKVYAPEAAFNRIKRSLDQFASPVPPPKKTLRLAELTAFGRMVWTIGFRMPGRRAFWRLFFHALLRKPAYLPLAMNLAGVAHHTRVMTDRYFDGLKETQASQKDAA